LPGPQSTAFFLLLVVAFGALIWWLVVAKQAVFRVLAACLAFIPAMLFGVAAVNKYYDYYQSWSAAYSDFFGQANQGPQLPATAAGATAKFSSFLGNSVDRSLAAQDGYTLHMTVHGQLSDITRTVYVYLPPQYFQSAYRDYRFPAIELLHGFPGTPQDWINVVGITAMMQNLLGSGQAKPVVLVMPDANGGRGISLQCLNQFNGPQDATFLARDLPAGISRVLRVQPPGLAWGIAGYSEGGFCAANLGLQYGDLFGYSGVLSGYFVPSDNQLGHPPKLVSPFGGNMVAERENTPDDLVTALSPSARIPQFWLGVGSGDRSDLKSAEVFEQLLQIRQPSVTLRMVPGGAHNMFTWRTLMPPLLEWMTPRLADAAAVGAARAHLVHTTHAPHTPHTPRTARAAGGASGASTGSGQTARGR
jgi:enterochelin esterase-like enzyme